MTSLRRTAECRVGGHVTARVQDPRRATNKQESRAEDSGAECSELSSSCSISDHSQPASRAIRMASIRLRPPIFEIAFDK
jgi:hypothetical protein